MSRWPVIRHIRYLLAVWRFHRAWHGYARGRISVPQMYNLTHLERIWEGTA